MRNSMGLHSAEDHNTDLFGIGSRGTFENAGSAKGSNPFWKAPQVHECWHPVNSHVKFGFAPCLWFHANIWATWQQMKRSHCGMLGVGSFLKSSCCTANMEANVDWLMPITIQKRSPWQFDKTNPPWGRMAHSTSPTVNRRSIPPWAVSRGRPPLRGT